LLALGFAAPAHAAIPAAASFTTEANHANSKRGVSATTAGDVNGDGYSDVIFADDGSSSGTSAVYVYLGGPSGNLFDPSRINFQVTNLTNLPQVCGIGDTNGDGYDDVAVAFSNSVRIYYGSASGIDAVNFTSKTFSGYVPTLYSTQLAPAGDVNGDGYADLLVGFPESGCAAQNSGSFSVFYGSASGINLNAGSSFCGISAFGYMGGAVGTAGDVNADGYADIVVGAYGEALAGHAYIYYGSAAGITGAGRVTLTGDENGCVFGGSVATAGDVNGDGFADIIIGAPSHDYTPASFTDCGAAYVYLGSASGISTSASWFEVGSHSGDRFGSMVATAGDVDGDGFADIIVGSPLYTQGQAGEGFFAIFPGSAAGVQPSNTFRESNSVGAHFGQVVGTAGDVNGDGFNDVLVSAPAYSNPEFSEGLVSVYLGAADLPDTNNPYYLSYGTVSSQLYGNAISAGGDFNSDGWPDMVVGSPGLTNGSGNTGMVSLLLGGPFGPSTSAAATYQPSGLAATGAAVSLQGDIDGDGISDVVVGLPSFVSTGGVVVIFYGNGGAKFLGTTGRAPALLTAPMPGRFGAALAVGDLNGDGYADLVVGAPDAGASGKVFIYISSGPSGIPSGYLPTKQITGNITASHFGSAITIAGDVNRDGYLDVVVGAPDYVGKTASPLGRWSLYRGASAGPDTTSSQNGIGSLANLHVGTAVAGIGDYNGDGYSDFAVGAPTNNLLTVYNGGPTFPLSSTVIAAPGSGGFGSAIAAAGDVDGDGLSDFLVGAPGASQSFGAEGVSYLYSGANIATPVWQKAGGQTGAAMGAALAAADFNGDGFSDLVLGTPYMDLLGVGLTDPGQVQAFLGNGIGTYRGVSQRNGANNNLVAPYGTSGSSTNFWLGALGRSAAGRTKVRMEWRAERTAFSPLAFSGNTTYEDTGTGGLFYGSSVSLLANVASLDPGVPYAWSARYVTRSLFFPHTPWMTPNAGGTHVYDIRTTGNSLAVDPLTPVTSLAMSAPQPNPARGTMTIACALPRSGDVEVAVLDLQGRHVRTLAQGARAAGRFEVRWDGHDEQGGLSSPGVYFVRLRSGGEQVTQRVVRLN
jgi:hypothetical protein